MSYLLAVDPGRAKTKSIGWCVFSTDGTEVARGVMDWDDLVRDLVVADAIMVPRRRLFFQDWLIEAVVVENFINNPKSRGGQTNGASEVIGAIEYAAARADDVLFVRQPPKVLYTAERHTGYKLPINPRTKKPVSHMPHQDAAYLHGFEYLISVGILEPLPLD